MHRPKNLLTLMSLSAFLMLALAAGAAIGAISLPIGDIARLLFNASGPAADPVTMLIIMQIRLPRVLLAALVGGVLALCGTVMQGIFRNSLADPYLLGIASGATAGAALMIALHLDSHTGVVPAGAFFGALFAVGIVYRTAKTRSAQLDNYALILSGVALAALFSSVTSFSLFYGAGQDLRRLVFWILGGLGGAQWLHVAMVLGTVLVMGFVLMFFPRDLNAFSLGEEMAAHLGVEPRHLRKILLIAVTFLTATAVAVSGTIGFVGLIVPHMMRLIVGPDHRLLLPAAMLGGAILLIICDTVARTILAPTELPVGIITALLGAPFFLFLLHWRAKMSRGVPL